jgi:hypothetical protein
VSSSRGAALFVVALPMLLGAASDEPKGNAAVAASSCVTCHSKLEGDAHAPLDAWAADVHAGAGLGCESCHGGDPSPAHADDSDAAMNPKKGFRPAPDRLHVPEFCGHCHADASFIKKYDPKARVDQLVEYRTSTHGRLNAKGDPVPATCIDCHGAHGIRPVSSPDSPAYATNSTPSTFARCHADAKRMAPTASDEPVRQHRRSVHAAALLERRDTAAPAQRLPREPRGRTAGRSLGGERLRASATAGKPPLFRRRSRRSSSTGSRSRSARLSRQSWDPAPHPSCSTAARHPRSKRARSRAWTLRRGARRPRGGRTEIGHLEGRSQASRRAR